MSDEHGKSAGEEGRHNSLQPKEIGLFIGRAVRQNLLLCILVGALISIIGSTVVAAMPLMYDATFKIFVQDGGSVTSAIASGKERYTSIDASRGLPEYIFARDNLLSIAREAKLVDEWPSTRPLPMRLKDRLFGRFFGPPQRKDMERGFVEMLATSITGEMDGSSVRVHAQWRSGQSAYNIANLVQRNFLAARASHDFGPIQRAIPFLEAQLEEADKSIEAIAAQLHGAGKPEGRQVTPQPGAKAAPAEASKGVASLLEMATLSKQLSEVRREQRALVDPWQARISELKAELVDAKASYSAEHPKVMQLEARIAAATELPEDLASLRDKEAELKGAIAGLKASARAAGAMPTEEAGPTAGLAADAAEDPELATSKSRFMNALRKSEEIALRLETTRIELATAQADFEHRYVVIEPAEQPDKPLKNKAPMLYVVVFLASILLGIVAAVVPEFLKDRLVESWQARTLGIPLLAEVDLKQLPGGRRGE